jgi:dienelactone hydrolase
MQFKALLLSACAMFSTGAWAQKSPVECLPQEQGALELKAIRPGFFTVDGRMGQFDPCESLVKYRVPTQKGPGKKPLLISVHGGSGIQDVLMSDEAFFQKGMATLVFDAYAMQGLKGQSPLFWARSVTNEARQRMIFATTLAAYRWALKLDDIDTQRIFLFGISNGAAVVANMAALVDPAHVKGVIAEGVTPIGMGLPDEIKVPLLLAFGKLDDFGVSDSNGKRWNLTDDCRLNIQVAQAPVGSSVTCNQSTPGKRIPTPLEWADSVQKKGGLIEILYVEDMAHNAYFGPLFNRRATWSNGQTYGASVGATSSARD